MGRYYNDFSDLGGEELEHYGVLGMRWGVRKESYTTSNSLNTTRPLKSTVKLYKTIKPAGKVTRAINSASHINNKFTRKSKRQAVHLTKQLVKTVNKGNKAVRTSGKKTAKTVLSSSEFKAAEKEIRKHLTLTGKIKASAISQDIKNLGDQWIKLKGRHSA